MTEPLPGEDVYHGQFVSVRVATLPTPSGGRTRFEIVEHPDAVAIVAARAEHPGDPASAWLVALVRQARPAVARDLWELPAGIVSADEHGQPLLTAKRELEEETGASAATWHLLAREYSSPGFTNETISLYLATDLTIPTDAHPADPTEIAQVAWMPLDEAIARCRRGEVADGKTLLGLSLAREALDPPRLPRESEAAMPLDPTNMPMQRSARYRDDGDAEAGLDVRANDTHAANEQSASKFDTSLKMENMLLEEYNYANLTAYQALEDRARLLNFYLTVVGILAGAAGAIYQLGNKENFSVGLILVALGIIAVFGVAFFVKLVRLRQAYSQSLLAMNAVKEYFIAHFERDMPDIGKAFRWRIHTIPATERFASVTFVVCAIVAFMTALSVGGASAIAYWTWGVPGLSANIPGPAWVQALLLAVIVAVVVALLFVPFYRRALNSSKALDVAIADTNEVRVRQGLPKLVRRTPGK